MATSRSCAGRRARRNGACADMKIADLSPEQRPRERLLSGHGEQLSEADLLALLWGSGQRGRSALELAHDVLSACGGLSGVLAQGLQEWVAMPGLGPARA